MINLVFNPTIILGLVVAMIVLSRYLLRAVKYEIGNDMDLFISTLGVLYGIIIVIHGWRLDPILIFSQLLLVIIILQAQLEIIRLRAVVVSNSKTYISEN